LVHSLVVQKVLSMYSVSFSSFPEPNAITVSRKLDGSQPLVGVDVDCGEIPDAAMTLAPMALFCEGKTTIRNVYSWRVKETERMVCVCAYTCTYILARICIYRISGAHTCALAPYTRWPS
jgi:hypothetical protein